MLILPVSIKPVLAYDLPDKSKSTIDVVFRMNPFNNDFNISSVTEQRSPVQVVLPYKIISFQSQECFLRTLTQQHMLSTKGRSKKSDQNYSVLDTICILLI
jgi:hypothetical protein